MNFRCLFTGHAVTKWRTVDALARHGFQWRMRRCVRPGCRFLEQAEVPAHGRLRPPDMAPVYRLHPRIVLDPCWACRDHEGRATGWRSVVRNGIRRTETCTICAGKGTIVTDAA